MTDRGLERGLLGTQVVIPAERKKPVARFDAVGDEGDTLVVDNLNPEPAAATGKGGACPPFCFAGSSVAADDFETRPGHASHDILVALLCRLVARNAAPRWRRSRGGERGHLTSLTGDEELSHWIYVYHMAREDGSCSL